tara:strand:- start:879 stop:1061 length:183 start_codon:yes stop_codon:yes gene_type:complete
MASTFLKNNFASMRGAISDKEKKLFEKSVPNLKEDEEDEDIIKGVISNSEMQLIKSLLPK